MFKSFFETLIITLCLSSTAFSLNARNYKCDKHPARSWWDVQHYRVELRIDTGSGFIQGAITIRAEVLNGAGDSLQIDLQAPMQILSVYDHHLPEAENELEWIHIDESTYFLKRPEGTPAFSTLKPGTELRFTINFEGIPITAKNPPWDGGMIRTRDENGLPWITLACQGIGASAWLPLKDHPSDEPDEGIDLYIHVPGGLKAIGNGKQVHPVPDSANTGTWHWQVVNSINNYNITFYVGDYLHIRDSFSGKAGILKLDYFVLPENREAAIRQFEQIKTMLACFEYHFGPYPFYEDGYKIVEAPYLGMEHQSAIAYGNRFQNGYLGKDRSQSGTGLLFDFILIHESAHEWFGNSISVGDQADTWVQEGFTTYAETLFAEWIAGKEAAFAYQRGKKQLIQNDLPVTGKYGVCDAGSLDHYDKAAFLLHMIRVLLEDDKRFFKMLREINERFYHQVVSGKEVETFLLNYLDRIRLPNVNADNVNADFKFSGVIFDQYLRNASLPVLQLKENANGWAYRWSKCVPGFDMPLKWENETGSHYLYPTEQLKQIPKESGFSPGTILPDFLIEIETK